jgi:hypothetical protein
MTERRRRILAFAGLFLWATFPFLYAAGTRARWQHRCEGRSFTGTFDSCFNDGLPVFELLAFPLTLLLAYPFARFAFSTFAPLVGDRSFKWRLAGQSGGEAYFPAFQITAAIGIGWAGLHLASTPLAFRYWYLIAYWSTWIGWFVLGAIASFPASKMRKPNIR